MTAQPVCVVQLCLIRMLTQHIFFSRFPLFAFTSIFASNSKHETLKRYNKNRFYILFFFIGDNGCYVDIASDITSKVLLSASDAE